MGIHQADTLLKKKLAKEEKQLEDLKAKLSTLKKGSKEHQEAEEQYHALARKMKNKARVAEKALSDEHKAEVQLRKNLTAEEKEMVALKNKMDKMRVGSDEHKRAMKKLETLVQRCRKLRPR